MTFLTVSETAISGRTCHTWLHVAYEVTPNKSDGFQVDLLSASELARVERMLRSRWKRHFIRLTIIIHDSPSSHATTIFEILCKGMAELTSIRFFSPDVQPPQLPFSLIPLLQHHEKSLKRLLVYNVNLRSSDLEVISQLSGLVTCYQYRLIYHAPLVKRNLRKTDDIEKYWGSFPFWPHRWSFEELAALTCQPKSRLTKLRYFNFEFEELTDAHLNCLQRLPSEAITRLVPNRPSEIPIGSIKKFTYFTHLRDLDFRIRRADVEFNPHTIEIMSEVLSKLVQLEHLRLAYHPFKSGELASLLRCQQRLIFLSFDDVTFESPSCLTELTQAHLPLERIIFMRCSTVRFDHLIQLRSIHSLLDLAHLDGRDEPPQVSAEEILTKQEQLALSPPYSFIFPNLKSFHFRWNL